jgi:hypothetical protein
MSKDKLKSIGLCALHIIIKFWKLLISCKRLWLSLLLAALFGLMIAYEWFSDTLITSHIYILATIYVLSMLYFHLKRLREGFKWIIDFLGLESLGTIARFLRFQLCVFGAFIISFYLLFGIKTVEIPVGLQFSIIPVTATLGGLVIAGANYSKLSPEGRYELIRVSQNLIVATIAFVFFIATFAIANLGTAINPNVSPNTQLDVIKLIFYWLSVVFFFIGTTLFVSGVVDLALGLKKIKKEALTH